MVSTMVARKPPSGRGAPSTEDGTTVGGDGVKNGPGSSKTGADQKRETGLGEPVPGTIDVSGAEAKTIATVLGEVVWLLTQSPAHKSFFLSDLEWMVMPPILLKQFRLFYKDEQPVGLALWALADEDVERRLTEGNAKLRPQDWRSGDRLWVADIVAPFGGQDEILQELRSQVFGQRRARYRALVDGKPEVAEI